MSNDHDHNNGHHHHNHPHSGVQLAKEGPASLRKRLAEASTMS